MAPTPAADRESGAFTALNPEITLLMEIRTETKGLEARIGSLEQIEDRARALQLVIVAGLIGMLLTVLAAAFWLGAKFGSIDGALERLSEDVAELRHQGATGR